ncbi:unnamed protein product [Didymodactylos carnosus]|uniref:Pre-C2HC domain-containing protein n=1 Tax=Didymodactylos carnosus TaxID=1234261 RepID=A0A8S2XZA2_9BILA|nr:unnamed protein product [Didymodactylos carnosus]
MPPTYAQQVITNTQLNRSNHQDPNYSQQIVIPPRPIVTSQATTNLQLNRNTVLPTKHTDFSRSLIIYPKVIMNVKWDTKTIMENFRSATENLQIKFVPQYAYPHPRGGFVIQFTTREIQQQMMKSFKEGLWDKTTFGGDFNVYEPKDNFSVVLKDVPSVINDDALVQSILAANPNLNFSLNVIQVNRLVRRDVFPVPYTISVRLIVETEELKQRLLNLKHLYIEGHLCVIQQYQNRIKPVQCTNCWKFSHVATACRVKTRCKMCGGEHSDENCSLNDMTCSNCNLAHPADSALCSKYLEVAARIKNRMYNNDQ